MARIAQIHPYDPVARRLFFTRIALGYDDQGAFAKAVDLAPNTYNEYEQAKKPLTMRAARLLRAKFSLPVEWLLEGVPDRLPHGLVKKLEMLGAFAPPPAQPERNGAVPKK